MMILLNGPNTPFGRLAWATALQLGIEIENRVIDVYSAGFLDALNPLRQIPTLVLDGGRALFDSRVICCYLHSLRPDAGLIPASDWAVETRWSLAVGLMEASVARTMEMRRQVPERNMAAIAKHDQRIARTVAALEAQADEICSANARIDRLAVAVVLEYMDFRAVCDWRTAAPRVARWLESETARAPFVSSRPYDLTPAGGERSIPHPQMAEGTRP